MDITKPLAARRRIEDSTAARALFYPLAGERIEVLAFAYLDADRCILGMRETRSDSVDRLDLPVRTVAADALAFDACLVVMAHNHPSGDPSPSNADREATHRLARALCALDIKLIDHLIVARGGVTSFRKLGLL